MSVLILSTFDVNEYPMQRAMFNAFLNKVDNIKMFAGRFVKVITAYMLNSTYSVASNSENAF
jgi:hypothetical protein